MRFSPAWLGILAVVAGCSSGGGGGGTMDSGLDAVSVDTVTRDVAVDVAPTESGAICLNDAQCSDGLYCNGVERCAPHGAGADASGCIHGAAPCTATQVCNEAMQMCVAADCAMHPDADGDGHRAIACGGDDCDDGDAHRFPHNPEVCLVGTAADGTLTRTGAATVGDAGATLDPTHDEDCDPTTFASATTHDGDHDGDGYVDHTCCNQAMDGTNNCGNDCVDIGSVMGTPATFMTSVMATNIHPSQTEVCNGVDDNCNGTIDEGLSTATYYPDCDGDGYGASAASVSSCSGQVDPCNGHPGVTNNSDCDDTHAAVHPGATEVCDGLDNDCNPATPDPTITCYADADHDGYRSTTVTMQMCSCAAGWLTSTSPLDCYDGNGSAHPGQTAFFTTQRGDGSYDYDCDGTQTEEWTTIYSMTCAYVVSGGRGVCEPTAVSSGWWVSFPRNTCAPDATVPPCGATGSFESGSLHPSYCTLLAGGSCGQCGEFAGDTGVTPQTQACR